MIQAKVAQGAFVRVVKFTGEVEGSVLDGLTHLFVSIAEG